LITILDTEVEEQPTFEAVVYHVKQYNNTDWTL